MDPEKDVGIPKEFYEAFAGIFHQSQREHLDECLEKFVQFRRDLGGHTVSLSVSVAQPMCIYCVDSWRWWFPELRDEDWPHISKEGWEVDLLLNGFHPSVIDELKDAISEGIDPEVKGPFCYDCRRPLPYWEDEAGACYVVKESLDEYIGHEFEKDAVSVGRSLRKAVVKVYGSDCFACGKHLEAGQVTIDHILPKSKGGAADILNLQPLCEPCNQEKADQPPIEKEITLHFPLRPLPSEAYEGWSW